MSRSYRVSILSQEEPLSISADDVEINGLDDNGGDESAYPETAYFNFVRRDTDPSTTVAAVPFREVRYITS